MEEEKAPSAWSTRDLNQNYVIDEAPVQKEPTRYNNQQPSQAAEAPVDSSSQGSPQNPNGFNKKRDSGYSSPNKYGRSSQDKSLPLCGERFCTAPKSPDFYEYLMRKKVVINMDGSDPDWDLLKSLGLHPTKEQQDLLDLKEKSRQIDAHLEIVEERLRRDAEDAHVWGGSMMMF